MLIADNNKRRTKKLYFFATKARLAVAHRIERKCALDIRIVVENSKRNGSVLFLAFVHALLLFMRKWRKTKITENDVWSENRVANQRRTIPFP